MRLSVVLYSLINFVLCQTRTNGFLEVRSNPLVLLRRAINFDQLNKPLQPINISKNYVTRTDCRASLGDYSAAAQGLFGNVIGPASMLAGGLVPLGFLAQPIPAKTKREKKLRCIYMFLSVISLSCDLLSIIYATVARNKLIETPAIPAASAFALIKRDYELSWLGTNLNFMIALFGSLLMVMIRAFTIFPVPLKAPSAGIVGSVILLSMSIINRGVTKGDGQGNNFGGSIFNLFGRYFYLLANNIPSRGSMEVGALIMGSVSVGLCIKALLTPEPDEE